MDELMLPIIINKNTSTVILSFGLNCNIFFNKSTANGELRGKYSSNSWSTSTSKFWITSNALGFVINDNC